MTAAPVHERVLIVDFGSQVTQLIARRLRESGVYCEIHPYDRIEAMLDAFAPRAVILSGGPASVHEDDSPSVTDRIFRLGMPVLGICYGEMTLCAQLGGRVEGGHDREFGRAEIRIERESPLVAGLGEAGYDKVKAQFSATALLGRISTPEQIASAVVWLLEPDCMVTGQQIVVDGGFMLGKPPSAAGATPASSGGAP